MLLVCSTVMTAMSANWRVPSVMFAPNDDKPGLEDYAFSLYQDPFASITSVEIMTNTIANMALSEFTSVAAGSYDLKYNGMGNVRLTTMTISPPFCPMIPTTRRFAAFVFTKVRMLRLRCL